MQNVKISLVIPAYNEAKIIKETVENTLSYLEGEFSDYELIISDDGSRDKTRKICEEIDNPNLFVVGHSRNRGKGSAVREGVSIASGDVLAYTDADLAYGLEAIGQITEKLVSENSDMAIGSRRLHPDGYANYPAIRLLASRCFGFITGLLAGFQYDTQCGLKVLRCEAAKSAFEYCECDGFAFDFELMMVCKVLKYSVVQFPVKVVNHRESKISVISDSLKMFVDVVKIRAGVWKRMRSRRAD